MCTFSKALLMPADYLQYIFQKLLSKMTTYIFSFTLQPVQLAVFAVPAVSPGEDLILSTAV